jgi:Zn-dependent peptidase ImmA (M78 family)
MLAEPILVDAMLLERCLRTVRELSAVHHTGSPPYSLSAIALHFEISAIRERLLNQEARLLVDGGIGIIEVNSLFPEVRRRMSVAHELAHIILNECAGRSRFTSSAGSPQEETLCNTLAGELLVPTVALIAHFENTSYIGDWCDRFTCREIIHAARVFQVSVDVMARRIFRDLRLVPTKIAVLWRSTENTSVRDSSKTLRISSAWHGMYRKTFIPINKTALSSSVVWAALNSEGTLRREEDVALGSLTGRFVIEAKSFGRVVKSPHSVPDRAVLSLIESTPSQSANV